MQNQINLKDTKHNMEKKYQPSKIDRIIGNIIITIYSCLFIFGIISFIKPGWLTKESVKGKQSEARVFKGTADELLRSRQYDKAIYSYQKALKKYPEFLDAITNLATVYGKLNQNDTALLLYNKALKLEPHYPEVIYFNMAEMYSAKGETDTAIKYYKISIKTDNLPSYSYNRIGNLLLNRKEYDSALWYFNESLKYKETIRLSLNACLRRDYYIENQPAEFQESIKIFEEDTDINNLLKNYDSTAFEDMMSRNRITAMNYNSIGYIYAITNQIEKSIPYFKSALMIWPDFQEALGNMYAANQKLNYSKK
jgi:tetratricopeptide (TPR) repeat protein